MTIRKDRWIQASGRQQVETKRARAGAGTWVKAVPASTKTILIDIPYARGAHFQLGLPLAAPRTLAMRTSVTNQANVEWRVRCVAIAPTDARKRHEDTATTLSKTGGLHPSRAAETLETEQLVHQRV